MGERRPSTFVGARFSQLRTLIPLLCRCRIELIAGDWVHQAKRGAPIIPEQQIQAWSATIDGTLDGSGAADHDHPYRFGRKPTSSQPFPFSTHQYARLLILRSRIQAGALHS